MHREEQSAGRIRAAALGVSALGNGTPSDGKDREHDDDVHDEHSPPAELLLNEGSQRRPQAHPDTEDGHPRTHGRREPIGWEDRREQGHSQCEDRGGPYALKGTSEDEDLDARRECSEE